MDGRSFRITSASGHELLVQDMPYYADFAPRAAIILVHALGDHSGRLLKIATRLSRLGFLVRVYDQFGHGQSSGKRGTMLSTHQFTDDLLDVIDNLRLKTGEELPLILMGFCSGALVSGEVVVRKLRSVQGLVWSGPALEVRTNWWQRLQIIFMPAVGRGFCVSDGLRGSKLTRNSLSARDWDEDEYTHDRISGRFVHFLRTRGRMMLSHASKWPLPTLVLYGGLSDKIADHRMTDAFVSNANDQVEGYCFEACYHEIFNEPEAGQVYQRLQRWLNVHFPAPEDIHPPEAMSGLMPL